MIVFHVLSCLAHVTEGMGVGRDSIQQHEKRDTSFKVRTVYSYLILLYSHPLVNIGDWFQNPPWMFKSLFDVVLALTTLMLLCNSDHLYMIYSAQYNM